MSGKKDLSSIIKVNDEAKEEMLISIKTYFLKERGEELGDLAVMLIVDFFMGKLAPHAYNQGVYDSYNLLMKEPKIC